MMLGIGIAGAASAPDQAIKQTTTELRSQIKQHHAEYEKDSAKFYQLVDQVVLPRFDIEYISKLVLGKHWKSASEAQRTRFRAAFKNNLVHSYANALLQYYDTVSEQWRPLQAAAGASDVSVRVDIKRADGPPLQLVFAVHKISEDWKVYDVTVNGVSLATNFRTQFGAEIQQHGLDALIQRLESGDKPLPGKLPTG